MTNQSPQNAVFELLDSVPSRVWYTLGVGSIAASALFQLAGRKNLADFVGKWPPTFLLLGLYHGLLRPGQGDAMGKARRAFDEADQTARNLMEEANQASREMMQPNRQMDM
ncbi:MAG: hypothetical protein DIU80_019810 [Chloroflexota bacterium]|nr:MAG: hypothetical protein DIU80_04045 [Chloroflexota bacterium]